MSARSKQTPFLTKIRHATHRHAKLALIPHRHNQYKPHLIRRQGLVVVLVAVIAAQLIGNLNHFTNILGTENHISVVELLAETNVERQKSGLSALKQDAKLSEAAYLKAKDMLANQYWAHTSPSGVQPWKWLADAGYNYSYAGENLARNFDTSQAVVTAWMASPSHRENILKPQYQDVGFATVDGVMNGHPISLVVAMYGAPAMAGAGLVKGTNFVAPSVGHMSIAATLGMTLQSASPIVLASLFLLLMAIIVALGAHLFRRRIPKYMQSAWNRHHGLAKALVLSCLVVTIVALYGTTGQL